MRARLLRDSAWIFGIVCAAYAGLSIWAQGLGADAHAYWLAWQGPMYTTAHGTTDAYLYSPAFAQILWPLAQLPWPVFVSLFTIGLALGLAWLLKPLGWKWGLPLWLAGLPEIISGNIFILMAMVAVVGFARPETWAFVGLTKISPTVGPVWFLVRGEWGQLIRSLLTLAVIAGLSVASAPSLWREWIEFLMMHLGNSTEAIGSPFATGHSQSSAGTGPHRLGRPKGQALVHPRCHVLVHSGTLARIADPAGRNSTDTATRISLCAGSGAESLG